MSYAGLPRETIQFLADLEAENNRDWFEAHRAEYQAYWLNAGLDLVAALAGPVANLGLTAVPKLNASLRRIHRDTRFSHDKRPYEPRLHLIFSTGTAFNKEPGAHVVIGSRGLGYGAGLYGLAPEDLERYRRAVCAPSSRSDLQVALAQAGSVGCTIDPPELTRLPKGFEAEPAWEHLLRRKSVIVRTQAELALPDWLFTPQAVGEIAGKVASLVPLLHWLQRLE